MSEPADDRQAIIDLTVAYGRAIDAGDFDALRELFTPDATAELGASGQTGIDEICERLATALAPYSRWAHQIGDHEVTVDGDSATARCSVHAIHVRPAGESPPIYTVSGTYEDRLVRTAVGWRITHRSLLVTKRA
ncbi:MAG TPA: nuclear transport factor 2 family protein [Acidimicrobiales bacterium]|nr:nuclear transport factor 2 family protein [Acidimicrobiales bacterium]